MLYPFKELWNAFFSPVETVAALRMAVHGSLNGYSLEPTMAELSSRFNTAVIWRGFQSVVDAFQFYHWQSGALVRALVYGCFEGCAEPWERAAFFPPRHFSACHS